MFLFLISFVVLPWLTTGSYAEPLGLQCSSTYTIEKPELKKTKVWKKCHDSAGKMKECLEKGHKISDIGSLVEREELLCEYISSLDHIIHYTDKLEVERASILKKYQKGKELKGFVNDLKNAFVDLTALKIVEDTVQNLTTSNLAKVAETQVQLCTEFRGMFKMMSELALKHASTVNQKALNVLVDYEDLILDRTDTKLALHKKNRPLEPVQPWTTPAWWISEFWTRSPHTSDLWGRDNILLSFYTTEKGGPEESTDQIPIFNRPSPSHYTSTPDYKDVIRGMEPDNNKRFKY